MKEIGEQLKSEREARGISIAEVSNETKIGKAYLEALEAGRFEALPGDPYNKAFIRSYARAIGWDATALLRRYDELKLVETMAAFEPEPEVAAGRRLLNKVNQTLQWLGL